MKITVDKTGPTGAKIAIFGRFDAFGAPEVAGELEKLFSDEVITLNVDLSETDFIDSTALAELVKNMKLARQAGGDLILCDPSEPVTVILELTALDKAFEIKVSQAD